MEGDWELVDGEDLLKGVGDLVEREGMMLEAEGELEEGDDLIVGVGDLVQGEGRRMDSLEKNILHTIPWELNKF